MRKFLKNIFQPGWSRNDIQDTPIQHEILNEATFQELHWPEGFGFSTPGRYQHRLEKYYAQGGIVRFDTDAPIFAGKLETHRQDLARFYTFCMIADQVVKEGLQGDFAELGVWQGNTAHLLAEFGRRLGRITYLLDTFEGFPQVDLAADEQHLANTFSDTSLEAVQALIGEDQVKFIKGYFPETAGQIPDETKFCIVHLDCDLAAPMKSALDFFYPRMIPGGFIIIHDYSSLCWDSAEKVVDIFFADKPEGLILVPDLAGTAIVRKMKQQV
jgi:O-methyltransferase